LAAFRGFEAAGVLATGKHFPGHGETAADSHATLPESPQTAARWRAVEFVPFQEVIRAGVPGILVAHLNCPALDPRAPSSLSRRIIADILRGDLRFDGVVVSDDMEMGAIINRFDIGEAAVRFLEAGGDLILICRDPARQRRGVAAVESALQSGRLSLRRVEASLDRLARFRDRIPRQSSVASVENARAVVGTDERRALLARILAASSALADHSGDPTPPLNAA
jgi:beta-N-acetylhexosaminidase